MSTPPLNPWDVSAPERSGLPSAFGLLPEDLEALGAPGRPELLFSRLQRPWQWLSQALPVSKAQRAWLDAATDGFVPELLATHPSEDGATKVVLGLADGERIEAVHMPREVKSPRVTLCLSSQVGCAMGCTFCATGAMGIRRNLTAGEIVGQVLALIRALGPPQAHSITLVFMGMGEPLHNLDHVHKAIRILNHPAGLNISTRRITVSTSGIVPAIERLADWLGDLRTGHNINLIRMNEHASSCFKEPAEVRLQAFLARLKARGCFVTVRKSRGRDVQGACGQLVKTD